MRRAFTLIEVLLAATLMAVVGLAVASVLGTQLHASKRMHQRSDRRALLSAIERRIRADLRAVVPPGGLYAAGVIGEDQVSAGGQLDALLPPDLQDLASHATTPSGEPAPFDQRDRLTIAVWPPARTFGQEHLDGEGAMWQVVYQIDEDPETFERGLVRQVQRVRDLAPGVEQDPAEEIAAEVVAMDAHYFDGTDWQDTWDSGSSDTLPSSVAVDLLVAHQGEVFVYRILVSTMTARPSSLPEATQ
ncbi:MAG: type II secretion system protein J [Planctomycetota bacterium]